MSRPAGVSLSAYFTTLFMRCPGCRRPRFDLFVRAPHESYARLVCGEGCERERSEP